MNNGAPYYAVIFTSKRTQADPEGYGQMAEQMMELAARQPGYLGVDHAREDIGITISYWDSLQAISNWKQQEDHLQAQRLGRERWYEHFTLRICRVEREYGFNGPESD
ncbi:Heme-degrading monooxygenase HmoA [Robiginitalea myxolifaciens]|uniref:Heme-degrading monooxygenase HmoA n=1 Tax=Robiginitalea myxolifaciens TaxID=400055 RepID=A0A1I6G601_9FLAO|nr:antibiotic biosynthesis monooxygenase [Robiginitalea myxolifaciens]SFR37580.1 Heme-degrading monooxygenase HmoA [Robiginitalea myxolifaciens]